MKNSFMYEYFIPQYWTTFRSILGQTLIQSPVDPVHANHSPVFGQDISMHRTIYIFLILYMQNRAQKIQIKVLTDSASKLKVFSEFTKSIKNILMVDRQVIFRNLSTTQSFQYSLRLIRKNFTWTLKKSLQMFFYKTIAANKTTAYYLQSMYLKSPPNMINSPVSSYKIGKSSQWL